jgi:hypothetical protein
MKVQAEGPTRELIRVFKLRVGEERAPLALMLLALYRQAAIYKQPLGGG